MQEPGVKTAVPAGGGTPVQVREQPVHHVHLLAGPGAPATIALEADEVLIGRGEDAAIHLSAPTISRRHALIQRRGGEFAVLDLDSAGGVLLNHVRVHQALLRDGDLIQLGEAVLLYREF